MKLGMPVLYEYESVKENIALATKLELDFIELNLNFPYCREYLEKVNFDDFFDNQLEATLHFYDEADFASYDEVVNAYLKLLERYARLGEGFIKMINIHLNKGPIVTISGEENYIYAKEYETYIKRLIKNLKKAKEICNTYHIEMVIENLYIPKFIEDTYYALYNEGFLFTYDIGHDNINGEHFLKILENVELKLKEMHIHDANKKQCHLALGEGEIDFLYYKELANKNDSYVVLEVKAADELMTSVPFFKQIKI